MSVMCPHQYTYTKRSYTNVIERTIDQYLIKADSVTVGVINVHDNQRVSCIGKPDNRLRCLVDLSQHHDEPEAEYTKRFGRQIKDMADFHFNNVQASIQVEVVNVKARAA
jgi:hypothetical protein